MPDGFKKYFNSTTINGRANVAKVTYATFAVMYLIYRVRRGSGKKPTHDELPMADSNDSSCTCDKERDPIEPSAGVYEADPECAVCRERAERAMTEFDKEEQRRSAKAQEEEDSCNGCSNPSPKPPSQSPPPSGGSSTSSPPRRKCPCDEPHNRTPEGPLKTSQTRARFQQRQYIPPSVPSEVEQARPVSEIFGQVHDAVYQAVCSVVAAVKGSAAHFTNSNSSQAHSSREDCGCNSIKYGNKTTNFQTVPDSKEDRERSTSFHQPTQQDDEEREEEVLLPRRTAPRSCVPAGFENQEQLAQADNDRYKRSDSQPQKDHYHHSFSDGFAAEMYFENVEE